MIGIGVDIGGTFVKLYIMDERGEILRKDKVETNYSQGAENFIKQIENIEFSLLFCSFDTIIPLSIK